MSVSSSATADASSSTTADASSSAIADASETPSQGKSIYSIISS